MRVRTERYILSLFLLPVALMSLSFFGGYKEVELIVDGSSRTVWTSAPDVGQMLHENAVITTPDDKIGPSSDATIQDGMKVEVAHARCPVLSTSIDNTAFDDPEAFQNSDMVSALRECEARKKAEEEAAHYGKASWYEFTGGMRAAHNTLPIGTSVRVTNLQSGRSIIVEINDRGIYTDAIIDLDLAAFRELADPGQGVIPVRLDWE